MKKIVQTYTPKLGEERIQEKFKGIGSRKMYTALTQPDVHTMGDGNRKQEFVFCVTHFV